MTSAFEWWYGTYQPKQNVKRNLLWNGALTLPAKRWSLESHMEIKAHSSEAGITASLCSGWCWTKMWPHALTLAFHHTPERELVCPPSRYNWSQICFIFTKKKMPSYHNSPLNSSLFTKEAKDFLISSKKCQLCAPTGLQYPGGAGHQGYHNNLPADLQFNSLLCKAPDTVQLSNSSDPSFDLRTVHPVLLSEVFPDLTSRLRNLGRVESGPRHGPQL